MWWYILVASIAYIAGVLTAYFRIKVRALGTVYINDPMSEPRESGQSYVYVEFKDDPATFVTEPFVTLEVKTLSQK